MQRLVQRIWSLPWPASFRRALEPVVMFAPLQRLVFAHFRIGVVGVVRDEQHRYLLFRHTYRREHPWGLPTGFMEHGERPADALRREVLEESGLTIELGPVYHVFPAPRDVMNVVFRGRITGGVFRASNEISEARWFTPESIPPLMPDQADLIFACEREDVHGGTA